MPNESLYYIVAPKDIVLARPRDLDDHVSWLLERERYELALAMYEWVYVWVWVFMWLSLRKYSIKKRLKYSMIEFYWRYEEALAAAESHEKELKTHSLCDIGQKYLDYLLMTGNATKAAQMCPKILKRDAALWETWVLRFSKVNQLKVCFNSLFSYTK
jgi:hypothetical protein